MRRLNRRLSGVLLCGLTIVAAIGAIWLFSTPETRLHYSGQHLPAETTLSGPRTRISYRINAHTVRLLPTDLREIRLVAEGGGSVYVVHDLVVSGDTVSLRSRSGFAGFPLNQFRPDAQPLAFILDYAGTSYTAHPIGRVDTVRVVPASGEAIPSMMVSAPQGATVEGLLDAVRARVYRHGVSVVPCSDTTDIRLDLGGLLPNTADRNHLVAIWNAKPSGIEAPPLEAAPSTLGLIFEGNLESIGLRLGRKSSLTVTGTRHDSSASPGGRGPTTLTNALVMNAKRIEVRDAEDTRLVAGHSPARSLDFPHTMQIEHASRTDLEHTTQSGFQLESYSDHATVAGQNALDRNWERVPVALLATILPTLLGVFGYLILNILLDPADE